MTKNSQPNLFEIGTYFKWKKLFSKIICLINKTTGAFTRGFLLNDSNCLKEIPNRGGIISPDP